MQKENPPQQDKNSATCPDLKIIAKGYDFHLPENDIEDYQVVLQKLLADCQPVLEQDLSRTDPVGTFDPNSS